MFEYVMIHLHILDATLLHRIDQMISTDIMTSGSKTKCLDYFIRIVTLSLLISCVIELGEF